MGLLNTMDEIPEVLEKLEFRSCLYSILAHGFTFPNEEVFQFLKQCIDLEISDKCGLSLQVRELIKDMESRKIDEFQSAYMQVYDPVTGPPAYEAELVKLGEFQKSQLLADIMGFYKAFGVEPSGDRADSVTTELEFMYFLTLKECHALSQGDAGNAAICRDAQEKFFRDHLGVWIDDFIKVMSDFVKLSPDPFYQRLLDLLQNFIKSEKEELA